MCRMVGPGFRRDCGVCDCRDLVPGWGAAYYPGDGAGQPPITALIREMTDTGPLRGPSVRRIPEGDIAFGPEGEWTEARPIWAQYHDIKGHDVEQFREPKTVTILSPAKYKTGEMIYPYLKARE